MQNELKLDAFACCVALVAITLNGCASNAPNPNNAPTTNITISADSGYGRSAYFSALDCNTSTRYEHIDVSLGPLTRLASFTVGRQGPDVVQIPIGYPINMVASYAANGGVRDTGDGSRMKEILVKTCDTYWTFTPEQGHTYTLVGNHCGVQFYDNVTNQLPTSYKTASRSTICPAESAFTKSLK